MKTWCQRCGRNVSVAEETPRLLNSCFTSLFISQKEKSRSPHRRSVTTVSLYLEKAAAVRGIDYYLLESDVSFFFFFFFFNLRWLVIFGVVAGATNTEHKVRLWRSRTGSADKKIQFGTPGGLSGLHVCLLHVIKLGVFSNAVHHG